MSGRVYRLEGAQRAAVDPMESVWLSASAGTGKTQVLSARVLRLLLRPDTRPEEILCLTFTKAGAAEMAVRVNEVLARWVRLPDEELGAELIAVGAPIDQATRDRARSLFANVLDTPGGGLRIDTIHAFAQYLLASFPEEARLTPGSRPMEDRERDLLSRQVLADMLTEAERHDDVNTLTAIEAYSCRYGPDGVRKWLMRCAEAIDLWCGPNAWVPPFRDRVHRTLGLPATATLIDAATLCADDRFPVGHLRQISEALRGWGTKTGLSAATFIDGWLAEEPAARLASLDEFNTTIFRKDGEPRAFAKIEAGDPEFGARLHDVAQAVRGIREFLSLLALADFLTPALELGRSFALRWEEAKEREGLVDFDDQIRLAARLLEDSDMAAWIRYKLDRQFDHVLIDEAQDTNADQWAIIYALIDDFFSGLGAQDGKVRTIFTVGDYKQAIFGFQGTSPRNFAEARDRVAGWMASTAEAAAQLRGGPQPRYLQDYDLDQSYRTAAPILTFVDRAIAAVGPQEFGLDHAAEPHRGMERPGLVTLWNPVATGGDGDEEADEGEQDWLAKHDRQMADRLAQQIAGWLRDGYPLHKPAVARNAGPGDIMVLVQRRRDLAALIVARLHARGVPVAGVDRLRLGNPLAVRDLMAALRFGAQPLDNLTLAALLVSPLLGWTQDDLLSYGYRPEGVPLWHHLRDSKEPAVQATVAQLRDLLARVDYETPLSLLHWILVGPWSGRRCLVERLGHEANDPIDELLNAAEAFGATQFISLQGFIHWFDAGDGELKREASEAGGQVRVMTVHGSKGLQAPIVVLADATGVPGGAGQLTLTEPLPPSADASPPVPLPPLGKDERVGPVAAAYAAATAALMQEHWRLMYVAMTRAEEALFIGGSLTPREKGQPHPDSWYARLRPLFREEPVEDAIWGARLEWGVAPAPVSTAPRAAQIVPPAVPDWLLSPVAPEPRPPRPLAPSGLGDMEAPDPPFAADAGAVAARRGVMIHRLLERLPDVEAAERDERARMWMDRQAADLPKDVRDEVVRCALAVLQEPGFAEVFGPGALAEVPFSAVVGGAVVAGSVDRLLVTDEVVRVVDYKTARRPPERVEDVPPTTLRQMAAYVAALEVIYPGRRVEAAVLYTQNARLFTLPGSVLEPFTGDLAG
ncbi:double-strand break repair helicase AddA [Porphyrobacter sp. GA68]|uniref:double-strand break repair helicase AddA n=1 Tax=Porphyrobacter sp. GA68 TaxID=2883480 RepID=UPI001D182D4E|nr:double-strand break repair helicase AddA [Porphyrobacter sp. GA68]